MNVASFLSKPNRCILYGQVDVCAMALGDVMQCELFWSTKVTFTAELSDRLPTTSGGKKCIIQASGTASGEL